MRLDASFLILYGMNNKNFEHSNLYHFLYHRLTRFSLILEHTLPMLLFLGFASFFFLVSTDYIGNLII